MIEFEDKILVNTFLLTRSETVFKHIYRKHTLSIYKMALNLTSKNMHAAEEIVQETWIRAVSNLNKFQWNSSFRTWLTGITINCSREYNRRNKSSIPFDQIEDFAVTPVLETRLDISSALAKLPEGYREVLILHDLEGFKHREIGQLLDISEGTSKSQLFQARKAIQKLLN